MAASPRKKKYDVESSFAEGSIRRLYLENFVYVIVAILIFNGRKSSRWFSIRDLWFPPSLIYDYRAFYWSH